MRNDIHERDPFLTRLFATQEQALPDVDFLRQVIGRLEAEHRRRRALGVVAVVAFLVIGVLAAPWIAKSISATGALLATDILLQGILGGAVLLAVLPVVYLWWSWQR